MSDIIAGEDFLTGQQVTAARLNNHVNGAQVVAGAIFNKVQLGNDIPAVTDPDYTNAKINTADFLLLYDSTSDALKKITVGDLFTNTISSFSAYPAFGSPGNSYTINPANILPRGAFVIARDSSEDAVAYEPRNWFTIGNLSYSNPDVKGYFASPTTADIVVNNTVDFSSNVNIKGDAGVNGIYVNNGYQLFASGTIFQLPSYNTAAAPGLQAYKNAVERIGLPFPESKVDADMKGVICYDTGTNEIAYRDETSWKTLASKSYVSSLVTDAVNGPVMKAMVVFSYADGGLYTVHKEFKIDGVAGSGIDNVHRVTFAEPQNDVYYAVSVDVTNEGPVNENRVRTYWSINRGLTYVDVYAATKSWSKSGGPDPVGTWTVIIWDLLPETTEVTQPDE